MVKKKIKNPQDLKGFEDFIEYLYGSTELSIGTTRKAEDNFELYTFLEQNNARLENLSELLSSKLEMVKSHPQDSQILVKQESHNRELKDKILSHLLKESSIFEKHLFAIFNNYFY